MAQKLFCGAGKRCITPPVGLLARLSGPGGTRFVSVDDDLYVRVIALQSGERKALIVSFDLDAAPRSEEYVDRLREMTGVPREGILFFATHTHSAPLTGDGPGDPRGDVREPAPEAAEAARDYRTLILEALLEAAKEAADSLRPARMGYGKGESRINVNRSCRYVLKTEETECVIEEIGFNQGGEVDHTLQLLRFEDEEGAVIALFLNYPVHCVTMFRNDLGDGRSSVSSDIGGLVSQCLEERFPGCTAVWSSGAAGDLNPALMTVTAYPDAVTGEPVLERIRHPETSRVFLRAMAGRHLADILQVLEETVCDLSEADLCCVASWMPLPGPAREAREEVRSAQDTGRVCLHLLRIGDIALIGVNGELVCGLGRAVQEASPLVRTMVINHDAGMQTGNAGYILDDETALACRKADIVKLPNSGYLQETGYIRPALQEAVRRLF